MTHTTGTFPDLYTRPVPTEAQERREEAVMPLKYGKSPQVIRENIRREIAHGTPQKQAVAMAMAQSRRTASQRRGRGR